MVPTLTTLLTECSHLSFSLRQRGSSDCEVNRLVSDSRKGGKNTLFAAYRGEKGDGHYYIEEAIQQGACAIIHRQPLRHYHPTVCYLQCAHPPRLLSALSSARYGHPSHHLYVIGVTGTDGKSTVVLLLYQLLRKMGLAVGAISTIASDSGEGLKSNPYHLTTPEAPQLQEALVTMLHRGYSHVVIEASSHALSLRTCRLADVAFDCAICTTISSEHLDFHRTRRQYMKDKARLFQMLDIYHPDYATIKKNRFAISGATSRVTAFLQRRSPVPLLTYRVGDTNSNVTLHATLQRHTLTTTQFQLDYPSQHYHAALRVHWGGSYNIANLLASLLATVKVLNVPSTALEQHIPTLSLPEGRRQIVAQPPEIPFTIIIDYAHTADAFNLLFASLNGYHSGRLIVLFGSAGERDRSKRIPLGQSAARYADIIYLTDEDPRGESSVDILEEIAQGIRKIWKDPRQLENCHFIPDRAQAIQQAVATAQPNDLLLLLGKGHERSIIYVDAPHPWSEMEQVQQALQEIGHR